MKDKKKPPEGGITFKQFEELIEKAAKPYS